MPAESSFEANRSEHEAVHAAVRTALRASQRESLSRAEAKAAAAKTFAGVKLPESLRNNMELFLRLLREVLTSTRLSCVATSTSSSPTSLPPTSAV